MPITRVPVIHKFGIISQSHQGELQKRLVNARNKDLSVISNVGRINVNESLEELLYQINIETDELSFHNIEEKISVFIQKVKHQLTSANHKTGWDVYQQCWKDLSTLANCCSQNISKDSLVILKDSLSIAPLSRHLVKSLLDIGLTCLQGILPNEHSSFGNNITLKIQVCFLVISRLHYHFMAKDLTEMHSNQLEATFLINKGIKKTLNLHHDHPNNYVFIDLIVTMVMSICKEIEERENEFADNKPNKNDETTSNINNTANGMMINKFYWNCLKLWKSISRRTLLESNVISELLDAHLENVQSGHQDWLYYTLSFHTLCDCSKLNIKNLKIFIQLGNKSNYLHTKKTSRVTKTDQSTRLSSKPEGTVNLQSTPSIFEKIDIFLNPTLMTNTEEKTESHANVTHSDSCSQSTIHEKVPPTHEKRTMIYKWDWELLLIYLNCLAEVCLHGLTIEIQKLALLGDEECFGIMDYLHCITDEHSWKVRCYAYQLLYELYHHFEHDSIKDGLKNVIWNSLMKFQEKEKDLKVMKIISEEVSPKTSNINTGTLFSLIATNMSIMVLPPSLKDDGEEEVKTKHCRKNKKTMKDSNTMQDATKIKAYNTVTGFQKNSYEKDSWRDVQKLVAVQYHKEVDENEKELQKLKIEMLKEEEDKQ